MTKEETSAYKLWLQNTPLSFQKKLVEDFTLFSIDYANKHIVKRQEESQTVSIEQLSNHVLRLQKWLNYVEFQEHTLEELKTKKLDKAFVAFGNS